MIKQAKVASTPPAGLWGNRNFNLFWAGQALDAIADSFAKITMPLLVLELTGSVASMGRITALIGVGVLAASVSANFFIDSLDRRRLMMSCDVGRALLHVLIPASAMVLGDAIWPIYVIAAVASYLTTLFVIAMTAAIPRLVDGEQLVAANGRVQGTIGLCYVLGPMLAGVLSAWLGTRLAVGSTAVLYALSALLLSVVRMRELPNDEQVGKKGSFSEEFFGGLRFIRDHAMLRWVAVLFTVFAFVSEATIDLTIFRLEHELYQSKRTIGLSFGVASMGALLAGLSAHALRRRWGFGACFLGGLALQSLAILGLGVAPNLGLIVVLSMTFTLGLMIKNINTMTLRQQVTPEHLLGRVSAAFWTLIAGAVPVGALLATKLAEWYGTSTVLVGMGLTGMLVVILGLSTPARANEAAGSGSVT